MGPSHPPEEVRAREEPPDRETLAHELELLGVKARTLANELRVSREDPVDIERTVRELQELQLTLRCASGTDVRWSRA